MWLELFNSFERQWKVWEKLKKYTKSNISWKYCGLTNTKPNPSPPACDAEAIAMSYQVNRFLTFIMFQRVLIFEPRRNKSKWGFQGITPVSHIIQM